MLEKVKVLGRPPKYEEETKVVSFRIPFSAEEKVKETVKELLTKLEI